MIDGRCDGCGEAPAAVCVTLGGEEGYFCPACAPGGPARPAARPAGWSRASYSRVCQFCAGEARYVGEDDQGEEAYLCQDCQQWQ